MDIYLFTDFITIPLTGVFPFVETDAGLFHIYIF